MTHTKTVLTVMAVMFATLGGCKKTEDAGAQGDKQAEQFQKKPDFGGIEQVTVQTTGRGIVLELAIDQAVRTAIRQVNGEAVDGTGIVNTASFRLSTPGKAESVDLSMVADQVIRHYQGAVTDFRIVKQTELSDGRSEVTISANVAKFRKPGSASMPRVAVMPVRVRAAAMVFGSDALNPGMVSGTIRQGLAEALTQTQRFTVLDRESDEEIGSELALIESGQASNEEFSRPGQALAADVLLIATIERFEYPRQDRELRTSGRTLSSAAGGGTLSYKLVNVATRQVVRTGSTSFELPPARATTLGTAIATGGLSQQLTRELTQAAAKEVVGALFPVTIVAMTGHDVVLSQGSRSLTAGQKFAVYRLGGEIKDPQTGQSLGRMDGRCCTVEVVRTTDTLSYGRLVADGGSLSTSFRAGELEVRERLAEAPRAIAPAVQMAASAPASTRRPARPAAGTDDFDAPRDKDW